MHIPGHGPLRARGLRPTSRARPEGLTVFDMIRFAYRVRRLMTLPRRGAEAFRAVQERRWRELIRHAASHSPFSRERLRSLDPSRCRPADVPPLTKSEMMANFDAIVTDPRV